MMGICQTDKNSRAQICCGNQRPSSLCGKIKTTAAADCYIS